MASGIISFLVIIPVLFFSFLFNFSNNFEINVVKRPELIESKGIYMTAYTAGWKERRTELVNLVKETELNSIVIDIKDYSGLVFFDTNVPLVNEIDAEDIRIPDLEDWLAELKKDGIYSIARLTVMQDPYLAEKMPEIALRSDEGGLWKDYKGLSWVDPTQRLVWEYNLDIAKEAVRIGFDEVNFDYIRFPSDGSIKHIVYANLDNREKYEVMAEFYKYVASEMDFYPIRTSADLFGMVLWRNNGLNIGQRYHDASPYFDYICPMIYPSHFPSGFLGFDNPADHPYEIIYESLMKIDEEDRNVRAKLRPWLQDFDIGAVYTPKMIKLQKQATYDADGYGWLLWNASNRYTVGGLAEE